ncbi:cationic amino acid transporter 2 isoform X2 [Culex pipiens pallens]|uniref:cationic amino acid transporter 2 isoform X2 n=1 Tax=Culex pipiens pallens TaxID=42434 RepID=UPI001954699C|nr:cationic amino acid transporter 2 isoform X2 [Culex pipiens pallens]
MKFSIPLPGGGTGLTLFSKLVRTKDLRKLQGEDPKSTKPKLTKCLTTLDLTSLGVGSCCGTGACYAEFGVRVPHTSGSAYMYSYVSVGEFVAFVIGWNMILEYLIGTSACACALSASFDSLSGGVISKSIGSAVGTIFGRPPDFIAFGITLLMTCVLALGASKSVLFNNVLNTVNLASWVFIVTAGLFYVDTNSWVEHEGFLPFGWSGVFTGAATCFYAFIGFDIIATTGEEAHNPQKSIPRAIVGSLLIVLFVYVTSSFILTLTVPYDHIDSGSALVQMWTYVGAPKCRALVAIGATAGLSVAMFGSMFPMPRVIYAMAQDGLVFRTLSQLWARTGVPGLATIGSGIAASVVALTVRLEVLVEMMSIGTLLAYTLVSTCVLILRYQPHSTSLVDLLPSQLRSSSHPPGTPDPVSQQRVVQGNVMVKKVITRGTSDSDDSFGDEIPAAYLGRDNTFLVSDKHENKFYGTVHGAPQSEATTCECWPCGYIGRKISQYSYLCPGFFPWVKAGTATHESGMFVTKLVGLMYALIFFLDLFMAIGITGPFFTLVYTALVLGILFVLLVISRQPQNRYALPFLTPGLPFIPTVAITVNIYLIFKLSILTLVRFTVWMSLGLIMYFYYGITHSSLENPSEEFELTVENGNGQVGKTSKSSKSKRGKDQKPAWDCHGYENRMATNDDGELHYGGAPSGNSWNEPSNGGGAWGDTSPYDPPPQSQVQFDISPVQPVQPPPNRPEIKKDGFGMFYQESSGQPYPTWED